MQSIKFQNRFYCDAIPSLSFVSVGHRQTSKLLMPVQPRLLVQQARSCSLVYEISDIRSFITSFTIIRWQMNIEWNNRCDDVMQANMSIKYDSFFLPLSFSFFPPNSNSPLIFNELFSIFSCAFGLCGDKCSICNFVRTWFNTHFMS